MRDQCRKYEVVDELGNTGRHKASCREPAVPAVVGPLSDHMVQMGVDDRTGQHSCGGSQYNVPGSGKSAVNPCRDHLPRHQLAGRIICCPLSRCLHQQPENDGTDHIDNDRDYGNSCGSFCPETFADAVHAQEGNP